ncbi:hypothetical protein VPH35_107991 [Triticum aestivum]
MTQYGFTFTRAKIPFPPRVALADSPGLIDTIWIYCLHSRWKMVVLANQPVVELVRWTVVSPTHQGSNPGARIIPGFISGFPAMRFQWEETFPSTTRRLR